MAIFLVWLAVAQAIYVAYFRLRRSGFHPPVHRRRAVHAGGLGRLIIVGTGVGFLFAALVLTISVVSFPLLLDRDVGAAGALLTSVRAVAASPVASGAVGLIVAGLLLVGSLPCFLGLTVVMPVLGHSTWHLYRRVKWSPIRPRKRLSSPERTNYRSAADFPSALFTPRE